MKCVLLVQPYFIVPNFIKRVNITTEKYKTKVNNERVYVKAPFIQWIFLQLETFNYVDKQGCPINGTNVGRSRDLDAALTLICQPLQVCSFVQPLYINNIKMYEYL